MAQATAITAPIPEQRLTMTYEEFLDWLGETRHGEWVDGEVIVFMPSTVFHARAAAFLFTLLSLYARSRGLGEILASSLQMRVRAGRSSREPDLFFVAHQHRDRVLELVSDDSVARDREAKLAEYAAVGVPEYWIHDPRPGQRRSDFYRLTQDGRYKPTAPDAAGRVHSGVFPGFWLSPGWLRDDPLPDPVACLTEIAPGIFGAASAPPRGRPSGDV
jgi:Uma2 family endonuclease